MVFYGRCSGMTEMRRGILICLGMLCLLMLLIVATNSYNMMFVLFTYNMMFVPFTGVDNHYRNVTLGAAIIGKETAETYSCLLNVFRQAFGRAPPVIVTDQDTAMRKAIEETWPESRHRLCMWHIMDKLTTKVS
ncbi:putative MULE transposase domain, FHY3/FAR1 family [Helianthus debilis subsp. tardiflorus]